MKQLKASTKVGQNIILKAEQNIGVVLDDVYGRYSREKVKAFMWCYDEYCRTTSPYNFHICSANTFGFTCAWYGEKENENILRFETKDNSYLVWLDR